ncbi:MAG: hypothetical protein HQL69_18950 [Magnetococcales bacterium]|nr:hypothetical protein [Magnetococcales bacterium]
MSHSRRKIPFCGNTTATSEKQDKRAGNRKVRRANRIRLAGGVEPIESKALYNIWDMDKDGKSRFDPQKFPELMRK